MLFCLVLQYKIEYGMRKILIINAGQEFAHSGGLFNNTVTNWTSTYFAVDADLEVQVTHIAAGYDIESEVAKFVWADVIIYHTPVWWFGLPYGFKQYLDEVLTAGHNKGLYVSDGRHSVNPKMNYGKGGSMQGTHYMLTTTWNAPIEAFTLDTEFFNQTGVDNGVMFGFHKMNAFLGMSKLDSFHFHDVSKKPMIEEYEKLYINHLDSIFKK
ncbi:MAG: hypothetical protein RL662_209 [Bacteroidota bacterium]|jgi:modulator of drug activity B